jgi:S-disulfanyl-L-cysteine oxidoreductase SoxD
MSRARCLAKRSATVVAAAAAIHALCTVGVAQTPSYPGVGRTPTAGELQQWDFAISPSGKELPPGSGTAKTGAAVYATKCAVCHGPALTGTIYGSRLIGSRATLTTPTPMRTVGSFWAYATTLWDYVNRAMPRAPFKEGSLTPNEVYAVTAFVLFKNGIIEEDALIDARTLPQVQMPNRDGFLPSKPDWQWYQSSCPLGRCEP